MLSFCFSVSQYTPYGELLLDKKIELTPLLCSQGEILIKCLEMRDLLHKSQCEHLLQNTNTYERIEQLLNFLATQEEDKNMYEALIEVLEENNQKVAAKFLKDISHERFPDDIQNDYQGKIYNTCKHSLLCVVFFILKLLKLKLKS